MWVRFPLGHYNQTEIKMKVTKKRQKYGLRKGCMKETFTGIHKGDIRSFPLEDVNVSTLRTRAGELNKAAGYTKYSVSVDNMTQTVRVMNNG